MIREVVREAWRDSPARFTAAVALTPVVLWLLRAVLVVAIVAGSPS